MSEKPVLWTASSETATGLGHTLAAASFSLAGFRRLLREAAFRQELAAIAAVLAGFALCGASLASYGVQIVLFLILVSVEALNTAIEAIVDKVSPEISEFAKNAKDLGSFAVFCMLAANAISAVSVVVLSLT